MTRYVLGRSILRRTYYFTIAYHVDGLMVDTGCAYTARELADALERDGKPVHTIVNTHSHEDHVAGNAELQRRFGARILCHRSGVACLACPPPRQKLDPYRKVLWGAFEPTVGEAIGAEVKTPHLSFRVLETPGHAPDHVCLYEPDQRWLFTGDLYLGGTDRAIRADYDIWQIIESLRSISRLEVDVMFPGAARVRTDFSEEMERKIAYYEALGRRVLELHRRGLSVNRIRRELLGAEGLLTWLTLGQFSGRNLVKSFLRARH